MVIILTLIKDNESTATLLRIITYYVMINNIFSKIHNGDTQYGKCDFAI